MNFVVEKLELLRTALEAAQEVGLDDRRLILLHRHLGGIVFLVDGNRDAGRDSFRAAVALARATGDNDLLAETISYAPGASFGVDPEFTQLAAAVLPLVDRSSPAALQLRMTVGYAQTMIAPPGIDLTAEYVDIMREASRQARPLTTFSAPWFFHASPDLARLLSYRAEGPFFTWAWARRDLAAAQRYLDELTGETRRLTPLMQGVVDQMQSLLAMARGDLDEAAHQTDLLEEHAGSDPMFAVGIPWQRGAQALWRGDVATARQLSGAAGALSFYPALTALIEAELLDRGGDREAALAAFEQAWAIGPRNLGLDWTYTGTLSRFAELASRFDMPERCAELEPLVSPFDGQFILETCIELRCSTAWLLGGLARAQGHVDEAIAHYERALAFETANGAVLMAERTRADLERARVSG
jgi:tetratricopeptide (TPR) repeat protein